MLIGRVIDGSNTRTLPSVRLRQDERAVPTHAQGKDLVSRAVRELCAPVHFPAPTEEDIRSFYSGDYHSELRNALATEEAFGPKFSRYVDMLGRHLYGGRVVDVGCSTGLLVRMLCDRGYEAEGVELNEHSAAWGVDRYKVCIHTQPLQACEFRAQSLDAVFMTDVLEHTEHPGQFLRDVGRLLVPGGFAVVTFPDISSVESRYQFLLSRLLRRDWVWSSCHIPLHVWEFSRRTAEACFADAGFRVVEFRRSQLPREENGSSALETAEPAAAAAEFASG